MAKIKASRITQADVERAINPAMLDALMRSKLEQLKAAAVLVYLAEEKKDVWRPSETSPPLYTRSFKIQKSAGVRKWQLVNFDPGAMWVEYGTHPGGGDTFTLRYRPMGKALIVMEATE